MVAGVLVDVHELTELVVERWGEARVSEEGGVLTQLELGPGAVVFLEAMVVNEGVPIAHCSAVVGNAGANAVDRDAEFCVKLEVCSVVVLREVGDAGSLGCELLVFVLQTPDVLLDLSGACLVGFLEPTGHLESLVAVHRRDPCPRLAISRSR